MRNKELEAYPSTGKLAKRGVAAVGGVVGGIALLVMGALPTFIGAAVGIVATAVGVGAILSKDPDDKKIGVFVATGGILALASKIGIPAAGTVLGLGGIGLLAMGIWNGVKFLRGLKSRA